MAVGEGQGTTISFSGWSGNLLSIDIEVTRNAVKTTHLGTDSGADEEDKYDTYQPGSLYDSSYEATFQFDPDTFGAAAGDTPQIFGAGASNLVITFPDTSTFTVSAIFEGFNWTLDDGDSELMTGNATWKGAGSIAWA